MPGSAPSSGNADDDQPVDDAADQAGRDWAERMAQGFLRSSRL